MIQGSSPAAEAEEAEREISSNQDEEEVPMDVDPNSESDVEMQHEAAAGPSEVRRSHSIAYRCMYLTCMLNSPLLDRQH